MNNLTINWGIIGCGDVTEVKSGPAFNKVPDSKLIAVMRRDAAKAADYAKRHNVPKWYSNADELINDAEINAIYIATPPAFHEEYTIKALLAGKHVYVEKPVATSVAACLNMITAEAVSNAKVAVAHYRRALPMFLKIKELINNNTIGKIKLIQLSMLQPHQSNIIARTEDFWRVDPAIAGAGLFYDLAPHQLDIIKFIFGDPVSYTGIAVNNAKLYSAEDTVIGYMQLEDDIAFTGNWCFTVAESARKDECVIIGEKGSISFPFFGNTIQLINGEGKQDISFQHPAHIQQPMIERVVQYFLGKDENPCTLQEALVSLEVMEKFKQLQ
ncbi:Gfo/Idh/MocA family protein [Ferruginibacter albus]|uniref:Gfo/Idh/MocA family protein n=1 Tax=Ferruginibacter albus TaxID=2875540 RepID=UPI001CC63F5F|nr:Gfo/Idh/MocA family oxidoreductase [Ferruginibacter albus]UAY53292.1 Gfo/Idh/MocA family oxidoreductase [Ferruginibacter albus]